MIGLARQGREEGAENVFTELWVGRTFTPAPQPKQTKAISSSIIDVFGAPQFAQMAVAPIFGARNNRDAACLLISGSKGGRIRGVRVNAFLRSKPNWRDRSFRRTPLEPAAAMEKK
jgi:hypothetical protein